MPLLPLFKPTLNNFSTSLDHFQLLYSLSFSISTSRNQSCCFSMTESTVSNDTTTSATVAPPAVAPVSAIQEESAVESDSDTVVDSDDESDCSDETDVSEASEIFWEREGALHGHVESSYLHGIWTRKRYSRRLIVNYDRCKPQELKRFVNDRLLQDPFPKGVTLKYFYIRTLEKADRQWSFRFLDLPPEMRLLVYRQLFLIKTFPYSDHRYSSMHPAILRSCKQIYEEARSVPYDELVYKVDFNVVAENYGRDNKHAMVHMDFKAAGCTHAKYLRVPQAINDYPEFLRRIARLEVRLTYKVKGNVGVLGDGASARNPYLYTLASFLMDGHRLKTLNLKLDPSSEMEDWNYGMVLYPLRRLRNISNVNICGYIPKKVEKKLLRDLKSVEPAFNTMRQWKLLADQAEAQFGIHEAIHGESECTCGECLPECIQDLHFHMRSLDVAKEESCFSSYLEENLIARLAKLRNVLDRVSVSDLEAQVKKLIEKRAALKEYEAVTDDGRLEEAEKIWEGVVFDDDLKYGSDHDWSDDDSDAGIEQADPGAMGEERQLDSPPAARSRADEVQSPMLTIPASSPTSIPATPPPQPVVETSSDEMDRMVEVAIRATTARASPEL